MEEKVVACQDYNLKPGFNKKVNQNMILMLLGKMVSLFGSRIYTFAIGLYVLHSTQSGMSYAITLLCGTLPRVILGTFAGTLADMVDRKKMVVLMDILSGLIVLSLFAMSIFDSLRLSYIYSTAVLLAVSGTFFDINIDSSLPNIVDDKRLMKLNSYRTSIVSVSKITAPLLGGLIYGILNIKMFLLINGLSFIASGISELFIDFELTLDENEKKKKKVDQGSSLEKIKSDIKAGFDYLKETEVIMNLTIFILFLNFIPSFGFTVPMPYIVNNILKLQPEQYGIIMGAFPVGLLLGSLVLSRKSEFENIHRVIMIGLASFGLVVFLTGVPALPMFINFSNMSHFIYFSILIFLFGVVFASVNIPIQVQLQKNVPDSYRGRVFGFLETVGKALIPIGYFLSGLLLKLLPGYLLPMISGGLLIILVAKFSTNEKLKKL